MIWAPLRSTAPMKIVKSAAMQSGMKSGWLWAGIIIRITGPALSE